MLKAIETAYKGYRFRSRLEARWAVFFDALEIPWEYEKEGFDLGEAGLYLPDFWLTQFRSFVEIKGQKPTEAEGLKAIALARQGNAMVMLVWGVPGEEKGVLIEPGTGISIDPEGYAIWCDVALHRGCGGSWVRHCNQIYSAYETARSARFEHGERP